MDGCSAPIVVKFADTQKEKEQKKMQQMQANLWNLATANMNISGKFNKKNPFSNEIHILFQEIGQNIYSIKIVATL